MNIFEIMNMNNVQYRTWCYIMDCHNSFMTLDELFETMETMELISFEEQSIQDKTWDYVLDIHDPDDIWYTTL